MNYPINFSDIKPDLEFYSEVIILQKEAENYLKGFRWCKEIIQCNLYTNIGSVFCIFLFEIINTSSEADNYLWVIAGDFPAMYLDTFGPRTTIEVTETYIDLAKNWIKLVENSLPLNECYPFDTEPTLELAKLLSIKIDFMKDELIPNMEDIEIKI